MIPDHCDVGGYYWYPKLNRPGVYDESCLNPPTHRWREPSFVDGHWAGRCSDHVNWLNAPGLVVEPITRDATVYKPQ